MPTSYLYVHASHGVDREDLGNDTHTLLRVIPNCGLVHVRLSKCKLRRCTSGWEVGVRYLPLSCCFSLTRNFTP